MMGEKCMTRRIKRKGLRWVANQKNLDEVPKSSGVYCLYYYGKRRYVGKSKNIQRRLKRHYRNNVAFTEFTWYETERGQRHGLERDLIDKDFDELWNEIAGHRRES